MDWLKCPKCGTEIDFPDTICPKCGEDAAKDLPEINASETTYVESTAVDKVKGKKLGGLFHKGK